LCERGRQEYIGKRRDRETKKQNEEMMLRKKGKSKAVSVYAMTALAEVES